jgi:hypothetical protein
MINILIMINIKIMIHLFTETFTLKFFDDAQKYTVRFVFLSDKEIHYVSRPTVP